MNVEFKNFRDNKNKLFLTYWVMNKGESFTTCDLSNTGLKLGDDNQILDLGCTFATQGSGTYHELDSGTIKTVYPGEVFNRRPLKAVTITALEDNSIWCYSLHFTGLFTTDEARGLNSECPIPPKVLTGEQTKISANETIELSDLDRNIYIANPLYGSEENTISYKTLDDADFISLNCGKYLKIKKGETCKIKSKVDTYIPKVYIDSDAKPFEDK